MVYRVYHIGVSKYHSVSKYHTTGLQDRKKIARLFNLTVYKTQYFGKKGNLNIPGHVYVTRGDGNCYFRAISYIITESEENHHVIRNRVVQFMCGTISDILQKYLNQSVNNYVNLSAMARNGVATDAEIMATASLFEHDIVVYTKSGDSLEWLTFPSSITLTDTSMTELYLENLSEHFNVVINVQS